MCLGLNSLSNAHWLVFQILVQTLLPDEKGDLMGLRSLGSILDSFGSLAIRILNKNLTVSVLPGKEAVCVLIPQTSQNPTTL